MDNAAWSRYFPVTSSPRPAIALCFAISIECRVGKALPRARISDARGLVKVPARRVVPEKIGDVLTQDGQEIVPYALLSRLDSVFLIRDNRQRDLREMEHYAEVRHT